MRGGKGGKWCLKGQAPSSCQKPQGMRFAHEPGLVGPVLGHALPYSGSRIVRGHPETQRPGQGDPGWLWPGRSIGKDSRPASGWGSGTYTPPRGVYLCDACACVLVLLLTVLHIMCSLTFHVPSPWVARCAHIWGATISIWQSPAH